MLGKLGCRFSSRWHIQLGRSLLAQSRVFVLLADARSLGGVWGAVADPILAVSPHKYEVEKLASAGDSRRLAVA